GQIPRSNAFRADATALEDLLEAHAGGRGSVLTPAVDLLEAGAAVEADRGFLVNARLEHEASGTQLLRRRFNGGQHPGTDPLPTVTGRDIHALRLGGGGIDQADSATPDCPLTISCHKEPPAAAFQVLGLEVGSEPLLERIQLT